MEVITNVALSSEEIKSCGKKRRWMLCVAEVLHNKSQIDIMLIKIEKSLGY